MNSIEEGCSLIVDTNILMDVPDIEELNWGVNSSTIYILESALNELKKLSRRNKYPEIVRKANRARVNLDRFSPEARNGGHLLADGNHLFFEPTPQRIPEPLDPTNVDHQQIAFAITLLRANPNRFCAIVTQDRKMADIAHAAHADLEIINPGTGDPAKKIGEQIVHLKKWKDELQDERSILDVHRSAIQTTATSRPAPVPWDAKERVARSLYARIRSAHHRAILAVSPLELRITLAAHMIPILTNRKRRVVFLFVPDEQAAEWWAGQMRRRCKLPSGSIVSFGSEPIERVGPVRLVIYRYDQIERRLEHHIARFSQAGKRITALVDGCDLLDPIAIAMLLFECDQFIGFTRLPGGHVQAVGSRMLDAFFQQQTVASYTFADAEQDGWLHAFDVRRRPVLLSDDEQELYRQVNEDYLKLHGKVTRKYPELKRATEFWQGLLKVLARSVDHKAAELFSLYEQREAVAQMAQAKRDMVTQLVDKAGKPARCLIFDYEQLWTPILEKHLTGQGWRTEVVKKSDGQDKWLDSWRKFEASKLDCLIVQNIPPLGLNPAVIKRLILLTTLSPLTRLAAMTDWVLSHANSGPSVCVDLLYTVGTPEQEAMMAFADTCCGLRFNL